ncbi:hypothetical protein MARPO_0365s0002 [Marchantia polymorpha]|uniref:14-3-3 domain-containing protein n=1 Tax=Marchantia polymorpha TaxID=3197 RepID=A0A2R6VYU2_MARPO|nr:hypothetical protein MARPO_0365s0002 [Marchantia polymorpha]|eukprot:PTQ26792.1 hypothetical protein MARPO_0365s0002 [Marchantia polymorpha]
MVHVEVKMDECLSVKEELLGGGAKLSRPVRHDDESRERTGSEVVQARHQLDAVKPNGSCLKLPHSAEEAEELVQARDQLDAMKPNGSCLKLPHSAEEAEETTRGLSHSLVIEEENGGCPDLSGFRLDPRDHQVKKTGKQGLEELRKTREDNMYLAKLAKQAERFDEMRKAMDKVVRTVPSLWELDLEERNLLNIAYKDAVSTRRSSWRTVNSLAQEQEKKEVKNERHLSIIKDYRASIESEINDICGSILQLVDEHILPSTTSSEVKVLFLKMKGDYHRYLTEFKTGDEMTEASDKALSAYSSARDLALIELSPTHPTRLALALNLSIFYYEIKHSPEEAIQEARKAFESAIKELDVLEEDSYKESTTVMQHLRRNLTLWSSDLLEDSRKYTKKSSSVRANGDCLEEKKA